jgi:hypothetical protein
MATWPTMTVTGGGSWYVAGGGITNHEVFAFTLQRAENDVGVYISNVTVFDSNDAYPNQTSYFVTIQAMDQNFNPVNQGFTGNFESNGV